MAAKQAPTGRKPRTRTGGTAPASPERDAGRRKEGARPEKATPRPPARPAKGGAGPRGSRPESGHKAAPAPGKGLAPGHDEELLYGRHAVMEALAARRRHVRRIYVAEGVERSAILTRIVSTAQLIGCPVLEVPRQRLDEAAPANHQGVVAQADAYPYVELDDLLAPPGEGQDAPLYLALDHLQDVQNLGVLLRTAEAVKVTGVILPGRRSAGVTPAVVNASAGAVEHLKIALVGNLVQALATLKDEGVWVVGLDAAPQATPLAEARLTGSLALVVGAEGEGLSRLARERCDWLVAIPMLGKVDSLNAAVAGSVVLVQARQARPLRGSV